MRSDSEYKPGEERVHALLDNYTKDSQCDIRDEIVRQYSNLVESVARRFAGASEPLEDLVQEGYIGLISSIDKYDQSKGVKFSTYATHFVIGQMKHYLRDKGKIIKEPAWLQEMNQRVSKAMEELSQTLNRQPTTREVADALQMQESAVRELLSVREVFKVGALDSDRDNSSGPSEAERLTDDRSDVFQLPTEDRIVLESALSGLKQIEQDVIFLHYYRSLNQTEIAQKMSISCNYVSHIIRNGTKKLRRILTTEEVRDAHIQQSLSSARLTPEEVRRASVVDPATGMYNRSHFLSRLGEEVSRAFGDRKPMAIMLMGIFLPDGIDPFIRKLRMESVLYTAGRKIRESVRKMDIMARYDENVFGLLLPRTGESVSVVSDRLINIVRGIKLESCLGHHEICPSLVTSSVIYPEDSATAAGLIVVVENRLNEAIRAYKGEDEEFARAA